MRTGGTTLVSSAGDPRVPVDACGGPGISPLLPVDVCGGAVIPGCDDDDGLVESTTSTNKKGANMTERVPVPSSEHVAEIVGRQGCKIKALRNKTNTYIKTPVRGEEPVFVVTGRQQDVDAARREIMSAAEHFTQIRASRRHHASKVPGSVTTTRRRSPSPGRPHNHRPAGSARSPGTAAPPTTTLGVRVPMSMVGLVVGPKGATIKRIQADTGTYIVTPGRDRDPVFEVIGSPDAVEKARQHIDAYIETRLAAATTTDQRELSILRPVTAAAGEVWSSGELNSVSSHFDLVESRDAISRLLSLGSDCSRSHPPTPAWHLPQASPPGWSNWRLSTDNDAELTSPYAVQSTPFAHSHSDPGDVISALYARMLIAETSRTTQLPTRDDYWAAEIELSSGCGSFGVGGGMSASGGSSAETGSFVTGPGGGGVLAELYEDDGNGVVDNNDNCWNAFSGFFDGNFSTRHYVRPGLGAAAGDESATSAGPWRLKPDIAASAVIGGGSCGSDAATSPSCSPAESSSGSAA